METERLYFRVETTDILKDVLKQRTQEQLTFFGLRDTDQLKKELIKIERKLSNRAVGWRKWNLIEKATGRVIGNCGFHNWLIDHERAELGYFLHENFRNKGFMSEALDCVIQNGFNKMSLNRIEAFISPDNLNSIKLVTKLGFIREGLLREHYKHENQIHDSLVYSLLKSEYNKKINPVPYNVYKE
jgi:ribosomal-protein-alanine N-acetyltransferase